MSPRTEPAEVLRTVMQRERLREAEEQRRARALPPADQRNGHRAVSSLAGPAGTAAFEPSLGSLGASEATAGGAREVVAKATPRPRGRSGAAKSRAAAPAVDAFWGSFGNEVDRALAMNPDISARVVIGDDDRVEVTNTEAYPWRCICSLRMQAQDGANFIGTGWLVSPRLVLTAGHCVFFHNHGGWPSRIEVMPGRRADDMPFGMAVATEFRSVSGWTGDRDREFDYGAILLPADSRFGDQLGWFGYAVRSDEALDGATLNLSGYPGDKPAGTQWFHARTVQEAGERVITYQIDTFGGQSGSPVWQFMSDGSRYGVGIHTNGSLSGNSATRITGEVFDNIMDWVGQAP